MEFYDDYDHPDERIEYILENDLMPPSANTKTLHPPNDGADDDDADVDSSYRELAELFDSRFTLGCTLNCCCCTSAASDTAKRCPCARDCRSATATNYVRLAGTESELILNPMRVSHDLLYECGAQCACPPGCGNRLLQFGPRRDLHIVQTAGKRWGVVYAGGATTNRLAAGAFVCEYVGEVLTASEASRRHASAEYAAVGGNYVLCLREQLCGVDGADAAAAPTAATTVTQTFIDPTRRGNVGRYLNHSCEPNCEIISVRVDGPIPRVGIFTCRAVTVGEELCFDYAAGRASERPDNVDTADNRNNDDDNATGPLATASRRTRCLCTTSKCRGFLPNLSYE